MFKTINDGKLPTRGSKHSACVDAYANETIFIAKGETKLIPLGICLDLEPFYSTYGGFLDTHYVQLNPRSSMRVKGIQSHTGIIDIDYTDEIKMIVHYQGDESNVCIKKGDRVGQLMLMSHSTQFFNIETEEERKGGFGSTGK